MSTRNSLCDSMTRCRSGYRAGLTENTPTENFLREKMTKTAKKMMMKTVKKWHSELTSFAQRAPFPGRRTAADACRCMSEP